ncbi:MAG: arginine--tRNA ligase, partial [Flavobacteriales bacterium]
NYNNPSFGEAASKNNLLLVEYSSPNTNKPLHLGHMRNIFVGNSMARILKAGVNDVKMVLLINDRGIHICKSMLAWKLSGKNETPSSAGMKGDKLVGKYYVEYDKIFKAQVEELIQNKTPREEAEKKATVLLQAQEMLRKWEAGDKETLELWKTMNGWVYDGFNQTYAAIGVDFDKLYYESDTYLLGKGIVEEGLNKKVFRKENDNSVWCDFPDQKIDPKVLQRSDGTSVYMTQDVGTAVLRYKDFPAVKGMIYVVGNEQDHHFKVLFAILKKLGYAWASRLHHLSYGMVDLPTGKMKSREGTVVDADDLVAEMETEAAKITAELGKTSGFNDEEKNKLYHIIALGALKYFILKVDAKKRMLFDPAKSIDFQGDTGPFIQYTHARINSLLIKAGGTSYTVDFNSPLKNEEKTVIRIISRYPEVIEEAATELSPAHLANYIYELVKAFNHFYQTVQILKEEDANTRNMRLALCMHTRHVVKHGLNLLGIEAPERM